MSAFDAYCELEGSLSGTIRYNEPMSRHTSFRIGGPARLLIECATLADLSCVLETITRHTLPWIIIGKGSNLLVADRGFPGAVLTLGREFKNYHLPDAASGQQQLVSGAGVVLATLVQDAFKNGYQGLEFAVGIPGTLGGALFMNAGSASDWIGSLVETLTVLRPGVGLLPLHPSDLPWAYRHSGIVRGDIIVEAGLRIEQGHLGQIRAKMEAAAKRRKKTQPLTTPNAGSIFRNPPGASAGRLIESCGLKGYRQGGAAVSEVHANFIINNGGATASDVVALIMYIQKRVEEEHGIELQPEIRFVGFE
ncbi:MAG: UDP-N-acetylmuramate dehydrogenase [Coriobacteriales bacterium]|nr:UDP-N-acetylmuramate dehydrogenase [Coriobacteriales bacterium]